MIQRTYKNFAGGVNTQIGPVITDMGDTEAFAYAEKSFNWEASERGLIKYPGDAPLIKNPLDAVMTGLFYYRAPGGYERIICKGAKIYTVAADVETEIYDGITPGAYFQAVGWDDGAGTEIIILMNGADDLIYYDGTDCDDVVIEDDENPIWDGAKPSFAEVFRGRILYGGDPTHPHRIWTPRPGTYNNFDNTTGEVDAFDIEAGFGGKLTGLKALTDDFLVIYKERVIRRLSGIAPFGSEGGENFQLRNVTNSFGCVAPRTIVSNDVEHYFLAEDGLRQLRPIESYGDIDPQQPTYPIQQLINQWNFEDTVIENACAAFHKADKHIWLAAPDGGTQQNNHLLIYDVISKGIDFRGFDEIKASVISYQDRKIVHGDYDGQVFQHGTVNYYGDY